MAVLARGIGSGSYQSCSMMLGMSRDVLTIRSKMAVLVRGNGEHEPGAVDRPGQGQGRPGASRGLTAAMVVHRTPGQHIYLQPPCTQPQTF